LIVLVFAGFGWLTNRAGIIEHGPDRTTFPIVAFELAGSGEAAEGILSSTVELLASTSTNAPDIRQQVESAVRTSLWWDFGFILGYSLLIFTLAPILAAAVGGTNWKRVGKLVGWSGPVAGFLDIIENVSLFRVLSDTADAPWAVTAAVASWSKWALVTMSLTFGLLGLILVGTRTLKQLVTRSR
jgi:hypothetical protein